MTTFDLPDDVKAQLAGSQPARRGRPPFTDAQRSASQLEKQARREANQKAWADEKARRAAERAAKREQEKAEKEAKEAAEKEAAKIAAATPPADWMGAGFSRKAFASLPDKAPGGYTEELEWVTTNMVVPAPNVDPYSAPSWAALTRLVHCYQDKDEASKTSQRSHVVRHKQEEKAASAARIRDEGRDLAETYRKLAEIKKQARMEAANAS